MAFTRKLLLGTTMIAGVTALAFAVPSAALAQVTPQSPVSNPENQDDGTRAEETADQAAARAGNRENEVEELVVTGSRIRRNEFTSAAPVQVITSEGSTLEGLVNPSEILQSSSVAAGSTQINNQFTGFVVSGGGGINTVSLRGLGDQRTLVLLNSRRLPPAGTQGQVGAVDLNVLPNAVIERYEILKTGASSIYGSDAIAGVVNVITRSSLDGGIVEVAGDLSERGGGEEFTISAAYGRVFDRGRFQISGEYYKQNALTAGDREDLLCQQQYTFNPVTGGRNDWIDVDTRLPKCLGPSGAQFGYIPVYLNTGAFYGSRAYISTEGPPYPAEQPIVGATAADANLPGMRFVPLNERDSLNPIEAGYDIVSPVERYTLYADGSYDFGGAEFYTEVLLHRRESSQFAIQQQFPIIAPEAPCPVNIFNCPGATAAGIPAGTFLPSLLVLTPFIFEQEVDVYRGVAGLRGEFSDRFGFLGGWDWDGYVSWSHNEGKYSLTGINQAKFLAGIGGDWAVSDFSGICPPGSPAGCRPLALFSPEYVRTGQFSAEDYAYLRLTDSGVTEYDQIIAEFQMTGDLFTLPAGAVGAAVGAVYRYDKLNDQPGEDLRTQNFYSLATADVTKGDDSVAEIYGELEVPIVRGLRFAEDLTVNLAGRAFNYDSFGSDTTYGLGLNYQITPEYRLRTTYGTSFRAPALYEQFLGDQGGFLGQASVDPCIRYAPPEGGGTANPIIAQNCAAQGIPGDYGGANPSAFLVTGGGENLKAETSKAFTAGFIWTPEFADINVAIDYYEIEVNDQVVSNGAAIVGQCYSSPNFAQNPFCQLFTRDLDPTSPTYLGITEIDASYRNIVSQTSRGIDLTTRYTREIGPGELTWDTQFTWTLEDTQELFPGFTDDFNNVIGEPAVVGEMEFRYKVGDLTIQYSNDFVGRQSNYEYQFGTDISAPSNLTTPQGSAYRAKNHTEPMWYHHIGLEYELPKWDFVAGIRNLFDEQPPNVSPALTDRGNFSYGRLGTHAFATQYDYIGRTLFASITRRF
jgi:iron complex outermembrane receptor protein